jgi:CHAT domain-containing protein
MRESPGGPRGLEWVSPTRRKARLPDPQNDPRLRSGLALAGANKWQERAQKGHSDGLLTALEAENLDLWGTELVVLSACQTGLGEVQVGEGVLGLRRAFRQAGAQTVLASLWKVPDAETEALMTAFMRHWLDGKGKAEALRLAQLDLIRQLRASKDADRKEAPPLYWAGFICHGQAD